MPNWCTTQITINHEDEKELEKLSKLIDEWTSKDYKENGFGCNWLGNIVLGSGIGTVDTNGETDLCCRGTIEYSELLKNQLVVTTFTAWSPMLQMWQKLLDKYLPGAELIYEAEESGCGLYCTNDPCMKGCYIIDAWDMENIETNYEATEEAVREILQKLLNTTESNVEKLIDMFEDSDYSENMSIHKWRWAEVAEWD